MSSKAIKRLARDLRELRKDPLIGANAAPLEDNMMVWHCTTLGPQGTPYEDIPLHWILEFTNQYPVVAPKAFFPITFGKGHGYAIDKDSKGRTYICMNIFSNYDGHHPEWKNKVGEGWSSSYTVGTVLLQFQSALSDSHFISHRSDNVEATKKDALKYSCPECDHDGSDPEKWRPILETSKSEQVETESETVKSDSHKIPSKPTFEPICYATRQNLSDDQPILGFGLCLTEDRFTEITKISSPYEFLSLEAYNQGVRQTSSKKKFDNWIPLYINQEHWERAQPEFESRVLNLMNEQKEDLRKCILNFFGLFMGGMFDGNLQMTINDHFIEGYFSMHRTLLAYEAEFKDYANTEVEKLLTSRETLTPTPSHSVDYWIMLIFLSKFNWEELAEAFLHEIEVKNTSLFLPGNYHLYRMDDEDPSERATTVFRAYRPLLVKIAFYAAFYQNIRGQLFSEIDHNNSMLNEDIKMILQLIGEEVRNLGSWQDFYQWIGLTPAPDNLKKGRMLIQMQLSGEQIGYITPLTGLSQKMYPGDEIRPVTNCPNRDKNYHRCSEICLERYGGDREKRKDFEAESDQEDAERREEHELRKKKRAWLRQSH